MFTYSSAHSHLLPYVTTGITFAALDADVDASVFHVTPEEIKSYIKAENSEQRILKKETTDNGGMCIPTYIMKEPCPSLLYLIKYPFIYLTQLVMIGMNKFLLYVRLISIQRLIFLFILTSLAGAVTFLFATENSKPTLARFVATLGDKEKAEVELLLCIVTNITLL